VTVRLNDAQQQVVRAPDGPVLVLAGAGSGKTRVIVERMVWLVEEKGVFPRRLVALTFTNKAAGEMARRFAARLRCAKTDAFIGTFHSFCLFLLRCDGERVGLPQNFVVFDDGDQLSLMKRLVKETGEVVAVTPRQALAWISHLKQAAETPGPVPEKAPAREKVLAALWKRYHEELRNSAAVDFDDLLVEGLRLLRECPDVAEKWRRKFHYVLVDEYQDTNRVQYLLLRELTEGRGNIMAVGDEDQAIYSWRGANISNILDFEKDFPGAAVFRLEQNYRSTPSILDAANRLVSHNTMRLGKQLWTERPDTGPVRFVIAPTAEAEADFIASELEQGGMSPRSVAILYRTHAQSRQIEEALRRHNIAYTILGGVKFYSRKEVKDIVAYLRLAANGRDNEALRRILNVPSRGIGAVTRERLEDYAAQRGIPLLDVLREADLDATLSSRARDGLTALVALIDDLASHARDAGVLRLAEMIVDRVRYREWVEQSGDKTDPVSVRDRLAVVDEFLEACREFDDREGPGKLSEFLAQLSLSSDVDFWEDQAPAATLMTCHSAKGLEFDRVYICGMEEGLFPIFYGDDEDDADLEEERRLCYVAMTRAMNHLTLTMALRRSLYGNVDDYREQSRFIAEIGLDRLQMVPLVSPEDMEDEEEEDEDKTDMRGGHQRGRRGGITLAIDMPGQSSRSSGQSAEKVSADAASDGTYKMGMRVRHARWGNGTILYVQGSGSRARVRVRFDTGIMKTLVVSVAPLEILREQKR